MKQQQSRFIRMGMLFMKRMELRLFSRYIRVGIIVMDSHLMSVPCLQGFLKKRHGISRLVLEGEDRLFRNLETKEQNHTVSYHFAAEDWQELADAEDSVFDCVIQREMIRNVLGCLTGRQRRVMEAYAVEGKTMKEVAKEMGITVPAVSWLLIRGRQRILREYPSLDRKGAAKGRNA